MKAKLQMLSDELCAHELYKNLNSVDRLQIFMHYHSFAVYDFMCLLKSLKNHVGMNDLFWKPSSYPQDIVRFVNEIVLGEESDLDQAGNATSHFMLYLKSMKEVGASHEPILDFIHSLNGRHFDTSSLEPGIREFVHYNLELSLTGTIEEVAGAFLFGREKLVPEMFQSMLKTLLADKAKYPTLLFYLERHIEVDGEDHGPKAEKCLQAICGNNQEKWDRAYRASEKSLMLRGKLWDACLGRIQSL
ncbi:MAG: DUF3050 domain-containing protein [Bacteriovoracaceae bacterium]